MPTSPDPRYRPTISLETLQARATLLKACRQFFDDQGFIEVQTPILSRDIVVDRHLEPLLVSIPHEDPRHPAFPFRFLQTSPEQNMKRLLTTGVPAIYQIGPVFRAGESGQLHNPEFTMLEWYRANDNLQQGIAFLESLVKTLLNTPTPSHITYLQAFQQTLNLDPFTASLDDLASLALRQHWIDRPDWSSDRDDWLNLLFSFGVQPNLGTTNPVVVTHFPASQAALAKLAPDQPHTAERFELFWKGIELANGFHELLDPDILDLRNRQANQLRQQDGNSPLPEQSWLLDAMRAGLPPCTGCALGFDRLVMLATNTTQIADVLCFPWDRA